MKKMMTDGFWHAAPIVLGFVTVGGMAVGASVQGGWGSFLITFSMITGWITGNLGIYGWP